MDPITSLAAVIGRSVSSNCYTNVGSLAVGISVGFSFTKSIHLEVGGSGILSPDLSIGGGGRLSLANHADLDVGNGNSFPLNAGDSGSLSLADLVHLSIKDADSFPPTLGQLSIEDSESFSPGDLAHVSLKDGGSASPPDSGQVATGAGGSFSLPDCPQHVSRSVLASCLAGLCINCVSSQPISLNATEIAAATLDLNRVSFLFTVPTMVVVALTAIVMTVVTVAKFIYDPTTDSHAAGVSPASSSASPGFPGHELTSIVPGSGTPSTPIPAADSSPSDDSSAAR